MQILSSKLPPPNRTQEWPTARAARGKFYGITDPNPLHYGDKLIVMSYDTWVDFGTLYEKTKEIGRAQDKSITELKATIAGLQTANSTLAAHNRDLGERLENLREVRRAEKRVDIERELIVPGSREFLSSLPTNRKGK